METVRLNEVCSNNFSIPCNADEQYCDYIELYNPTGQAIRLKGYTLSDNKENLQRFVFDDVVIEPKGYLTVCAVGEMADEGQAAFKISNEGETLILSDEKGKMLDVVTIPVDMKYNTSYARSEDGSGAWAVMEASPGWSNEMTQQVLVENAKPPVFSAESGFYEKPFMLELIAKNNEEIFYTLDGSEPTLESKIYSSPILIEDVSGKENVHSARTDLSAGFFAEEDRFEVPTEKVDKAVVVRAAVFKKDGSAKSETVTKTYFVGYDKKAYEDFSVISLVTDPDNFFDYESGIYVSGKRFSDFVNNGEMQQLSDSDNWYRWKGNYNNKGKEWERPIHIEYFDSSRTFVFSQNTGIRIKGNATRALTQKSFNLYARNIYSRTEKFDNPFWGEYGKSRVTLYAGGNDYRTKIKDALINKLCEKRNFSTMKSFPCYVFLNGEYWGIYQLMESYGESYLEEHYGISKGDSVIIKNNALDVGEKTDNSYLEELKQLEEEKMPINEKAYAKIEEILDMQSYIDYYCVEIYIGNKDWPGINEACWRTKEIGEEKYQDGRWRWMLFDVNYIALSDSVSTENMLAYTKEKSKLFHVLTTSEKFRRQFTISFCDIANTIFKVENVAPVLMEYAERMRGPAIKDLKKYYGTNKMAEEYDKEIDDISKFFLNRSDYALQNLASEFGLTGTLENVSVGCSEGGSVMLNTVEIPEGTECFIGQYFTDYPIDLTALPKDGYRFVGWSGDVSSEAAELEVKIKAGGVTLQAVFEKE